jgi:uncharacterized membrane protein
MQPHLNPYESPQAEQIPTSTTNTIQGWTGTIDQRMAFPENSTVELRRWKQHYNSLILFVIGLVITLLACFGTGIAFFAKAGPDNTLFLAAALFLFALGIASLIGVVNRSAWTVPLIWIWVGIWTLISIGGAIAALSYGSSEAFVAILQILVYVVVLIVFVGKALAEADLIFGPARINEHELKEELAYREMNSIP